MPRRGRGGAARSRTTPTRSRRRRSSAWWAGSRRPGGAGRGGRICGWRGRRAGPPPRGREAVPPRRRPPPARARPSPPSIAAIPRGGALPLSFAQERLWFLEQLEGSSPLYHIPMVVEGVGRLDLRALQAALSGIWSRHEALRARFVAEDRGPLQTFA